MGNCCDSGEARKFFSERNNMKHQLLIENRQELTVDDKELMKYANQIVSSSEI